MNLILATDIELLLVGMWKGQASLANSQFLKVVNMHLAHSFIYIIYLNIAL